MSVVTDWRPVKVLANQLPNAPLRDVILLVDLLVVKHVLKVHQELEELLGDIREGVQSTDLDPLHLYVRVATHSRYLHAPHPIHQVAHVARREFTCSVQLPEAPVHGFLVLPHLRCHLGDIHATRHRPQQSLPLEAHRFCKLPRDSSKSSRRHDLRRKEWTFPGDWPNNRNPRLDLKPEYAFIIEKLNTKPCLEHLTITIKWVCAVEFMSRMQQCMLVTWMSKWMRSSCGSFFCK